MVDMCREMPAKHLFFSLLDAFARMVLLQSCHSKWSHLTPRWIGDSRDDSAQVRGGVESGIH